MTMCKRPCRYRHKNDRSENAFLHTACNYLFETGKTRTMTIAYLYGCDPGSPEHKKLMKPENCPLYIPRNENRIVEDAYGKKTLRKRKPYVPPADEKLLLELYAAGLSDYAIGMKLGVAESRIRWWRYKRGFTKHKFPEQ